MAESSFRFLAIGDLPYHEGDHKKYELLLERAAKDDFSFMVHVGDIKSGESLCNDAIYHSIAKDLAALPFPVVYSPGDNEWTDCNREACGSYEPVERLAYLRKTFHGNDSILKLDRLGAVHQSSNPEFSKYVENYRFEKEGVLFIAVHVIGSENNRQPNVPGAVAEWEARNRANVAFLKESFALAEQQGNKGVVIIFHAEPFFENSEYDDKKSWQEGSGFKDFLETIYAFLMEYRNPVLAIHGDYHFFKIDKPLYYAGTGHVIEHFTRLEVFGEDNIHGVAVTVDPNDPQIFSFRPYLIDENRYEAHPKME